MSSLYIYKAPRVKRPYLFRNPIISQVLSGANPLRLFALARRFSPTSSVAIGVPLKPYDPHFSKLDVTSGDYQFPNKPILIVIMDETWYDFHKDDVEPATLFVDFIPTTVLVTPNSSLTPIKIVGANNPPYHFAGSEDTIMFKIDWYGYLEDPVIKKCRFMESLCKADGWTSGPPSIKLYWGDTNRLFKDHYFVVTKAPYSMRTFTRYKEVLRGPITNGHLPTGLAPYHLWPIHATQTITMKRITDHQLTHAEIRQY